MKIKIKILVISLLLIYGKSFGQTIIADNSNISGNWTLANSPYIIEGRAIVQNGQILTIEPGVEVRLKSSSSPTVSWFDYNAGNVGVIRVQGEIIANGTDSEKILFTRDGTGFWGTLLIDENASSNSSFMHCIIEYSKESRNITGISFPVTFDSGISLYKSNINFENNVLRENQRAGMYIREVSNLIELSNNEFYNNGANALVISESTVNSTNNIFYDNSFSATGFVSAIRCSESDVFLVGNLIYNNDDFAIFTTNNSNVNIVNNTIYGNFQGIRVENGANTYISNSIIENNEINFATGGTIADAIIEMQYSSTDDSSFSANVINVTGNILNTNATFVNSATGDFSLQSTSDCVDAGNPNTTGLNIPNLDVFGKNRIENSIIDIGAVEFQQPLSVVVNDKFFDLKIYPNPIENIFHVASNEKLKIKIFSIDGKFFGTYETKIIDISNLKEGVYILKIENSTGKILTERILKK
ncbi:right-handed parallel beta-helix repeat-containing protein [Psychroflexus salis]|uniref:Por secretion system C-terminal sorting domain-containing protein n=1 Tax=Psychroflexus salis TaxID=1526574 RepID=A0A916ZV80_9FLAO|nr:right-handed parallel beta-helix repeat-containing protein [Psychroflexus salis]GGE14896.1 hypothetical protein GCM10010831_15280 [Psychroflexus salis]